MDISLDKLRDFIRGEMTIRQMSMRQFAEHVHVPNSTIARIMDETKRDKPYTPDVRTLLSIAQGTNTDIGWLFSYIANIEVSHAARVNYIATRLAQLPADKRQVIEDLITFYARINEREDSD